jgi:hypothetical protein
VHRRLRRSGGVTPPREFVLMDRAAIGLGSVFLHLRAEINWHRLFHGMIDGVDLACGEGRQAAALKHAKVPTHLTHSAPADRRRFAIRVASGTMRRVESSAAGGARH